MMHVVSSAPTALALRRGLIAAMCLAVTLGAHLVAVGGHRVGPAFAVVGGTIVIAAMLLGPRRRAFAPRRLPMTLLLVVTVQALAHVAMGAAPWAFGLAVHHDVALVTPAAVALHALAALAVGLLVFHLERLVAAAIAAVGALRAWLGRPARRPRPAVLLHPGPAPAPARIPIGSRAARAPPPLLA